MITYVRHKTTDVSMASNTSAQYFEPKMLDGLKFEIKKRFANNPKVYQLFEQKLKDLSDDWLDKIENHELKNYEATNTEIGLLVKPAEKNFDKGDLWSVMQSMREIDTNSFIKVGFPRIKKHD